MVPPKKLLFIGRTDPDTGYPIYVELAKTLKLELTVITSEPNPNKFISQTDYVFASGYLSILEVALARKLILVSYSNPVRHDYLLMHPLAPYMIIGQSSTHLASRLLSQSPAKTAKMTESAHAWAVQQTWPKLAATYETLWQE